MTDSVREPGLILHHQPSSQCYVVTLAYGKIIYLRMAINLARSFLLHNRSPIEFILITDSPDQIPADLSAKIHISDQSEFIRSHSAQGFLPKLFLDRMLEAQSGRFLFVDSDCLVYSDLTPAFTFFSGNRFSCVGQNFSNGEWFGDIASRCSRLAVQEIPVFVGAIYYFELSNRNSPVLEHARAYSPRYDELGLVRLRGFENEEPLVSIGMAIEGIAPMADSHALIKADAMFTDFAKTSTDILHGQITVVPIRTPALANPRIAEPFHPLIFHYNDAFVTSWFYKKDAMALKFRLSGMPSCLANILSRLWHFVPGVGLPMLKDLLRPLFRSLFGIRSVKRSIRI